MNALTGRAALCLVLLGAASGCGSSSGHHQAPSITSRVVSAWQRTLAEPNVRVSVSEDPGTDVVVDLRHRSIETSATPSASNVGSSSIYADGYQYVRLGSGQKWIRQPDPGSRNYLANRNLFPSSAAAFRADVNHAKGGLKSVGQVTIRGVTTTDYRALVTSPSTDRDGIAVDTFVGDDGLVHRYTLASVLGASGSAIASPTSTPSRTSTRLSIDFYDFGTAGDVVAPTDVTDNAAMPGGPTDFPIPSVISDLSSPPT